MHTRRAQSAEHGEVTTIANQDWSGDVEVQFDDDREPRGFVIPGDVLAAVATLINSSQVETVKAANLQTYKVSQEQRARAEKAEAERDSLRSEVARLSAALTGLVPVASGGSYLDEIRRLVGELARVRLERDAAAPTAQRKLARQREAIARLELERRVLVEKIAAQWARAEQAMSDLLSVRAEFNRRAAQFSETAVLVESCRRHQKVVKDMEGACAARVERTDMRRDDVLDLMREIVGPPCGVTPCRPCEALAEAESMVRS